MKKILDWLPIILCLIIALFLYYIGIGVGEIITYFIFAFIGLVSYFSFIRNERSRNAKIICASIISILVLIINYFVHWAAIDWRCTLAISVGLICVSLMFNQEAQTISIGRKIILGLLSIFFLGGSVVYIFYQTNAKLGIIREYEELVADPTIDGCERFITWNDDALVAEYADDVMNLWVDLLAADAKAYDYMSQDYISYISFPLSDLILFACENQKTPHGAKAQAYIGEICDSLYAVVDSHSTISGWNKYQAWVPVDYLRDSEDKGSVRYTDLYSLVTIHNDSKEDLKVSFQGPQIKKVTVKRNSSVSVRLKMGKYKVSATTDDKDIRDDEEMMIIDEAESEINYTLSEWKLY